ncbi:MAG: DUF305 domain-containing protein [Pyrinomonadaceae bacterium]
MKINLLLIAILVIAAIGFGCGTQTSVTNANSMAGMNHNGANMPMNAMNGNMQGISNANMDHSMMKSSANAASAPYDLQFIDTMTAHHQGAVDMAVQAYRRAEHAEIKSLAANITSSQQSEMADMKGWRDKWFPGAAPALNMEMTGMSGSMKGMDTKMLDTLSGNEYDLAFIRHMIPHHEGAVLMAKEAQAKATKPLLKSLAEAIIKAQEAEIKQMKAWQTAWQK